MREIVIVIADLYLDPEAASPARARRPGVSSSAEAAPDAEVTPGIEHCARFGEKSGLPEGWRAWVAHWLGLAQYAHEAPARIAAAALADVAADRAVWLATPLHLIAGLTSLHSDRRSILRLPAAELARLAADFRATFRGSGYDLQPLASGELLLAGPPAAAPATTIEPARMLLASVAEALPRGDGAPVLRRLSAEIEMWLHAHPVNEERARRGALPAATLWLWGGGAPAVAHPGAARAPAAAHETATAAFGRDAYVHGLWRLAGGETRPMPVDWAAVIGEPGAQRALAVMEVAELLHANASWRLADAVAAIDRRLLAPALAALHGGRLERLVLLANDRSLTVRAADRWRLWRRMRTMRNGLEALA